MLAAPPRWHKRVMDGLATTTFRIALGLGLVAIAPGAGVPPVADAGLAVPAAFVGIPAITVRYYDVSGRTAAEIRASLNRNNAADPVTGVHFDAYTVPHIEWRIPGDPAGPCRVDRAKVTLELTVGLPRLVDTGSVPPGLLRRWKRYRAALEAHEAMHARNAVLGRKAVLAAIREAECATADRAGEDALADLDYLDESYDRLTRHGAVEGAFFP